MMNLSQMLKVGWFYCRSFFHGTWQLDDYPLQVTHRTSESFSPKFQPLPWTVAIVNWWQMRGDAETLEGARENLRTKFAEYASENALPRPGTGAKFGFSMASTDLVEKYQDIAREVMPRILGYEFDDCLITDESSLGDFPEPDEEYLRKLGVLYGLHPSSFPDLRLVTIFEKVATRGTPSGIGAGG